MEPINGTSISPGLNVVDLEEAEVDILKQVQSDAFPSEIRSLQTIQAKAKNGSRELDKEKNALLRKASFLRSLEPVLYSDGIMRVGERIRGGNPSVTLKNPIILPKSSHITSCIIGHVHERTRHGGRGMTLNELRASGYWIVSGNVWNAITFLCGFLLLFCEVSPLCVVVTSLCCLVSLLHVVVTSLRFVVSSLCLVMQS